MQLTAYTRYGARAASTRQRLLQFVPSLEDAGIHVRHEALLDDDYVLSLTGSGTYSKAKVAAAYARRLRQIASEKSDIVWIYGELFPFLPSRFETLALRQGRPVVYDFDDAFFHNYDQSRSVAVRRLLGRKLEPLLTGVSACTAGNPYLLDYARRFCRQSVLLPTVVDTDRYRPRANRDAGGQVVVGWIGSPSTWPYLRPLLPVLARLVAERNIRVRVVGAGAEAKRESFPGLELVDWTEDGEVDEVRGMDIGIMPVPDDVWAKGKSGYKLIQYLACGVPGVASPVGVNRDIIDEGVNGFLCTDLDAWHASIRRLIDDPDLRRDFGEAGRAKIVERYSLGAAAPVLVSLLKQISGRA